MDKKGNNFQSLYSQKFRYGALTTDTSGTAADRDLHRKKTVKGTISVLLILVLLAGSVNYLVARQSGRVLLSLGEEIACGESYSRTTTRSLGFCVHKFEGNGGDYTVISPWGRKLEEPYAFRAEQMEQVLALFAKEAEKDIDYGFEAFFLPTEAFTGVHVYYTEEEGKGVTEIGAAVSTGVYASYKGQVYVLEEKTAPMVLQVWDDNGQLRVLSSDMYRGRGGQDYWINFFRDKMPEGLLFDFRDTEDAAEARAQRDEAAAAYFEGEVSLDSLEVDGEGNLKIYRPDIEGFNPEVDMELKYVLVEETKLEPIK